MATKAGRESDGTAGQVLGWVGLGAQVIGAIVESGADPAEVVPVILPRLRDWAKVADDEVVATRTLRNDAAFGRKPGLTTPPSSEAARASAGDPGDEHR